MPKGNKFISRGSLGANRVPTARISVHYNRKNLARKDWEWKEDLWLRIIVKRQTTDPTPTPTPTPACLPRGSKIRLAGRGSGMKAVAAATGGQAGAPLRPPQPSSQPLASRGGLNPDLLGTRCTLLARPQLSVPTSGNTFGTEAISDILQEDTGTAGATDEQRTCRTKSVLLCAPALESTCLVLWSPWETAGWRCQAAAAQMAGEGMPLRGTHIGPSGATVTAGSSVLCVVHYSREEDAAGPRGLLYPAAEGKGRPGLGSGMEQALAQSHQRVWELGCTSHGSSCFVWRA